jgi:nanoRNase/pAp phosphatase (c-di-AMP/oligoRNAs hydrolase)
MLPSQQHAQTLLDFLAAHARDLSPLLILTHDYPDPDALSSATALAHLAGRGFGIRSKIVYGGIIGRTENRTMAQSLKLPLHKLSRQDFTIFKHIACVDTQPGFRNNALPAGCRATIVIDQHPSLNGPKADCLIVDPGCGATCVLLAQAILLLGLKIPSKLATAIVYGILTDTNNFLHVSRADAVQTYIEIIPRCDMKTLSRIQSPERPGDFFRTLSRGIGAAMRRQNIIVSHLGPIGQPDVVAQLADMLLTYRRVEWAMCTGRYRGSLRVSLRAKRAKQAACDVLRDIFTDRGSAGGHDTIAGGILRMGESTGERAWKDAERGLTENLAHRLKLHGNTGFKSAFE